MFAIVDIETTGGNPTAAGITEICVVVTDGKKVLQVFESLIQPGYPIPRGIVSLTGISESMLKDAPVFAGIAAELHHLLHDKIFVAHNVNFDFGFIQSAFAKLDMDFHPAKLCTVKLSRKAFPGKRSYSLGEICSSVGISIQNRHRAGGDAFATSELFNLCYEKLGSAQVIKMAHATKRKVVLPPALTEEDISRLPDSPGVYFFKNQQGKILYTGKANNIQKRVRQHFDVKRGKTALQLEKIDRIDFETCGNELVSLLTEAVAIHEHWPEWNVSGKHVGNKYAIYQYPTQSGMLRLQTEKHRKGNTSGIPFPRFKDAKQTLGKLIVQHKICPVLARAEGLCHTPGCYCGSENPERTTLHNQRVEEAVHQFQHQKNQMLITGPGRAINEKSLILVENGAVVGWGFSLGMKENTAIDSIIKHKPDIPETRAIISGFFRQHQPGDSGMYQITNMHNH
jgi:DNA polymerase-3 subunit epsilon